MLALAGLVSIVTNPRAFSRPSSPAEVFALRRAIGDRPNARVVGTGPAHLKIFVRLCLDAGASGNLAGDAQHGAVAVEYGGNLVATASD